MARAANKARRDIAGADAALEEQVPTRPGRLQACSDWSHGVSQHTVSTQKPDAQAGPLVQDPPLGIGVLVRVCVAVAVAVGV